MSLILLLSFLPFSRSALVFDCEPSQLKPSIHPRAGPHCAEERDEAACVCTCVNSSKDSHHNSRLGVGPSGRKG